MKVSGPGQVANVSKTKSANKAAGEGFSKFLDSTSSENEVSGVGGVSKISSVNFINAVEGDEQSRRRKLTEDGEDLLDELSKIRDALLIGNLSVERLRSIQSKVERMEANCEDPKLNEIIEEIKTRAAVELAKLGRF